MKIKYLFFLLAMNFLLMPCSIDASTNNNLYKLTGRNIEPDSLLSEFEDDLNIIGVDNEDGTNTIFIYPYNIKYYTTDGSISYVDSSSVNQLSLSTENAIYSSTVASNYPTNNYGAYTYNSIGTSDSFGVTRTYIKFDMESLSTIAYDDIHSASYNTRLLYTDSSVLTVAEAYFVKSSWNPSTITWNNMPDYYSTEKICAENMQPWTLIEVGDEEQIQWQKIYITSAVQAWLQGLNNNGIVLIARNDVGLTRLSSDNNTTYLPYLEVTYYVDEEKQEASGVTTNKFYYLINKNSKLALTASSLISGDDISQTTLNSTALQTFKLVYLNNGYYAIKIENTDQCLAVNDLTAVANGKIIVSSYTGSYAQQWKVIRNWDGSYQFISRQTNYSLAVKLSSTLEGASIIQYPHSVNFFKQDDWTLIPSEKGVASLYGFTKERTGGLDTSTNVNSIKNLLSGANYSTVLNIDCSAINGYETLQSSDIWHFSGHGDYSSLSFGDSSYLYFRNSSSVAGGNIKNLSNSALKSLQLCTMASCLTGGDSSGYNLVGAMYQKGAHLCVAYTRSVTYGLSNDWYYYYYLSLASGHDALYSLNFADTMMYNSVDDASDLGDCIPKHIMGDTGIFFVYDDYPTVTEVNSDSSLTISPFSNIELEENNFINSTDKSIYIGDELVQLEYVETTPSNTDNLRYDIYMDEYGGIYEFYSDTNIFASYTPYYDSSKCGDYVVDRAEAIELAKDFIEELGYDLNGFEIETSNEWSKRFIIEFVYYDNFIPTDEIIRVEIMANHKQELFVSHIKSFDYGEYSEID